MQKFDCKIRKEIIDCKKKKKTAKHVGLYVLTGKCRIKETISI